MTLLRILLSLFILTSLPACQLFKVKDQAPEIVQEEVNRPSRITLLSEIELSSQIKMTDADEETAQKVLELNYTKQPSEWRTGADQNITMLMTPTRTFQQHGVHCRDYSVTISKSNTESLTINAMACRYGHQLWTNVSNDVTKDAEQQHISSETNLDNTQSASLNPEADVKNTPSWIIQLASFYKKEDAIRLVDRLNDLGSGYDTRIVNASVNDRIVHRVQINIRHDRRVAEKVMARLKNKFEVAPLLFPSEE